MRRGLYEILMSHHERGILPMHMPGHKRNPDFFGHRYPTAIDVTEIDGMDDLHRADGILNESMAQAAEVYGSEHTFFLVNGSTSGILAGIRAATKRGDTVLIARNCHLSVFHSVELCGLNPIYIQPAMDESVDYCGNIQPHTVAAALAYHPETSLIVLTSPTYEGVISDIRTIATIAHERGVPLLVDEAHGSHLGFSDQFPESAVHLGADMVVQSLHKTLPSLTQTALLHLNGNRVSLNALRHNLRVFQTSSPSYIFMAAIDDCIALLKDRGISLLDAHARRLHDFHREAARLTKLFIPPNPPTFFGRDPSKIIVSTSRASLSGPGLSSRLLHEHNIQCEMAMPEYALLMTSLSDSDEAYVRLLLALKSIDGETTAAKKERAHFCALSTETVMTMEAAIQAPQACIPASECGGRICAEYIYAYPPGIPLILPGERIPKIAVEAVSKCADTVLVVQ